MMKRISLALLGLVVIVFLIAACASKPADRASKIVEDYIHALVNKDSSRLSALSCAAWEPSALLELDSLQAVKTRLDGLTCSATTSDSSKIQVHCQGKILATYSGEEQQFDLSARTYQVTQDNGEFLVCGYEQ